MKQPGDVKSVDVILFSADMNILLSYPAARIGTYEIPDSVTSIGEYAFLYLSLSEVTFSDTVYEGESYAFAGASLEQITILQYLDTTVTMSSKPFTFGNEKLKNIAINGGSEYYESVNGVLYRKCDGYKILWVYPSAKKDAAFKVLNKTAIHGGTFEGCRNLKNIYNRYEYTEYGMWNVKILLMAVIL